VEHERNDRREGERAEDDDDPPAELLEVVDDRRAFAVLETLGQPTHRD
jgi:hypothetical protein